MVEIIVLINVKAGTVEQVFKHIAKIDGVKKINVVTGTYDIIVYAELPSRANIRGFISEIHEHDGIDRTETCVVI